MSEREVKKSEPADKAGLILDKEVLERAAREYDALYYDRLLRFRLSVPPLTSEKINRRY